MLQDGDRVQLVHGLEDLGGGKDFPEGLLVQGPSVRHDGNRADEGRDCGHVVAGRDELAHGGDGGLGDEMGDSSDVG